MFGWLIGWLVGWLVGWGGEGNWGGGWMEVGWREGGESVNRPIRTFPPGIGIGEKANHTKPMAFAFFPPANEAKIKKSRMLIHHSLQHFPFETIFKKPSSMNKK